MEKNVNDGVDDDYYDEHDDRVQDTNDYYQWMSPTQQAYQNEKEEIRSM